MLLAFLLAAHNSALPLEAGWLFSYSYWLVRGLAGFVIFYGLYMGLLRPLGKGRSWLAAGLSFIVALPVFVMVTITLDLALGQPELGFGEDPDAHSTGFEALFLEMLYLADNYFFFCLALFLTDRLLATSIACRETVHSDDLAALEGAEEPDGLAQTNVMSPLPPALMRLMEKPLGGAVMNVEAQEHYIRIHTREGSALLLYRFMDAVQLLEEVPGLQVHRSHWVADSAVAAIRRDRGQMKIQLNDGREIPVSRRFEQAVSSRFSSVMT